MQILAVFSSLVPFLRAEQPQAFQFNPERPQARDTVIVRQARARKVDRAKARNRSPWVSQNPTLVAGSLRRTCLEKQRLCVTGSVRRTIRRAMRAGPYASILQATYRKGNSYGVRTIRRADIYRQETPTEFGRSDVPTSIDRKLLRSSDDPTCRQLSTGNSYGVDPSHEAWICQGTVRKSRVRSPIVVNTRRIEPNIDVIGPIRSRRFSCPSTPVSAQESTVRPLPP